MFPCSLTGRRPWQDPLFRLALLAGPLVWIILYLILRPEPQWGWPLASPLQYLLPVVVYPVLEEIVFRGVLLGIFLRAVETTLRRRSPGAQGHDEPRPHGEDEE